MSRCCAIPDPADNAPALHFPVFDPIQLQVPTLPRPRDRHRDPRRLDVDEQRLAGRIPARTAELALAVVTFGNDLAGVADLRRSQFDVVLAEVERLTLSCQSDQSRTRAVL